MQYVMSGAALNAQECQECQPHHNPLGAAVNGTGMSGGILCRFKCFGGVPCGGIGPYAAFGGVPGGGIGPYAAFGKGPGGGNGPCAACRHGGIAAPFDKQKTAFAALLLLPSKKEDLLTVVASSKSVGFGFGFGAGIALDWGAA